MQKICTIFEFIMIFLAILHHSCLIYKFVCTVNADITSHCYHDLSHR